MKAWFPTTMEGQRAPVTKLHFAFADSDHPRLDGETIAATPKEMRSALRPDGDGTLLTFVNTLGA